MKGVNLERFRPWVIVAESIDFPSWESYVLDSWYKFTLFDGLNRFYVDESKWETLGEKMSVPANVLDGYKRYEYSLDEDGDNMEIAFNCYRYILGRNPESKDVVIGAAEELENWGG